MMETTSSMLSNPIPVYNSPIFHKFHSLRLGKVSSIKVTSLPIQPTSISTVFLKDLCTLLALQSHNQSPVIPDSGDNMWPRQACSPNCHNSSYSSRYHNSSFHICSLRSSLHSSSIRLGKDQVSPIMVVLKATRQILPTLIIMLVCLR